MTFVGRSNHYAAESAATAVLDKLEVAHSMAYRGHAPARPFREFGHVVVNHPFIECSVSMFSELFFDFVFDMNEVRLLHPRLA